MISLFLFFILCKRCGRCCYYVIDGKTKKCKHLVRLSNDKTLCRIYKTRLGTKVDKDFYCGSRGDNPNCSYQDKRIIDGCPYNS